jgi:hypothetical protein
MRSAEYATEAANFVVGFRPMIGNPHVPVVGARGCVGHGGIVARSRGRVKSRIVALMENSHILGKLAATVFNRVARLPEINS